MSKLEIRSIGMIKKGKKWVIPSVCHIVNCNNIPQKGHVVCDYHYSLMEFLRDDKWSRNFSCTMLLPEVGRVS